MAVLLISDLHLDPERPNSIPRFVDFVQKEALYTERLYILGDLFEAWIGDDEDDPRIEPVIEALARLHTADVPVYLMHGNRDFLIGQQFSKRTGVELLDDYELVTIYGRPVLLTHGDLLCTDDAPYMELRKKVRNPAWQEDFLSKSVEERRTIASDLRKRSQTETARKPEDIMDVNQTAVELAMLRHGVRYLVHGHTHRPAVHHFSLEEAAATRIVLGDWYEEATILRWEPTGFKLAALVTAD
jgi:UDP-2,3-diacylglucosamine hydrolase